MPIYHRDNRYAGVNAHLHSIFQAQGGWSSLHTNIIAELARHLNSRLPEGYLVDIEQSLQIRHSPINSGKAHHSAVVIYQTDTDAVLGKAVTRIELLSPGNKRGAGYLQYREKRVAALRGGVALVEIDLLHETPPVVKGVPPYPTAPGSHAYTITTSDPTPTLDDGFSLTYGFAVGTPLPTVALPVGAGAVDCDFDAVYQSVYLSLSAYSRRVDYAEPPPNLDRYSDRDQAVIRAVMTAAAS